MSTPRESEVLDTYQGRILNSKFISSRIWEIIIMPFDPTPLIYGVFRFLVYLAIFGGIGFVILLMVIAVTPGWVTALGLLITAILIALGFFVVIFTNI